MKTVRRKKTPSRKRSKRPVNNVRIVVEVPQSSAYRDLENYMRAVYPANYKPCGPRMILLLPRNARTGEPNRYFTSCGNIPK